MPLRIKKWSFFHQPLTDLYKSVGNSTIWVYGMYTILLKVKCERWPLLNNTENSYTFELWADDFENMSWKQYICFGNYSLNIGNLLFSGLLKSKEYFLE